MRNQIPTKPYLNIVLISASLSVVLVVSFLTAILLLSNSKQMRYHNQYIKHYESIYCQKGPVDIALGGSSRVIRGIYAPYLIHSLTPLFNGRRPTIYNLGVYGKGSDAQIRILLDLLNHRKVKYIFFQVSEFSKKKLVKKKFTTHRDLKKFGALEDILLTPLKGYSLIESLTHRSQLLYERISETVDTFLSNPTLFSMPAKTAYTDFDATSKPKPVDVRRLMKLLHQRETKRNGRYFRFKKRAWSFEQQSNHRTGYYLDLLIAKAHQKGTTLILMDFPKFEWNTISNRFDEYITNRFGDQYLHLNRDQLLQLGVAGYADYGHVNLRGEKIFRNMIIDYFKSKQPVNAVYR